MFVLINQEKQTMSANTINTTAQTQVTVSTEVEETKVEKVWKLENEMYELDWSDCEVELTAEVAAIFANIMLPNNLDLADPDDFAKMAEFKTRQEKLANLILTTGFQPFACPEEVVIVFRDGKGKEIPKHLLNAWLLLQTGIVACKEVKEKGVFKYRPVEKELATKDIANFSVGTQTIRVPERTFQVNTIQSGESLEGGTCVYADEVASFHAAFAAIQLNKLSDLQVAELAHLLRPELEVVNDDGEIGVLSNKDNQSYYFSFSNKWLTTRSGRNPKILSKSVIWMQTVNSRFSILSLAIWLGARKYDGSVDGVYSKLPNLFSRITEDNGASYSVEWEADHPTRLINEDLRMPITFVEKKNDAGLSVYPFCFPENVRHNPKLLSMIIKREGDATCDKYNTTFVAGAKASNAAGTYLINGKKRSLHDMKGTKMLNRPMQARKHLSALAELISADGTIKVRERSLFTVKLEEENQG
jgi:hypothetical protein